MASAAWTNYLAWRASTNGFPGCVFDRWASTGRSCDQTASGVEALQQVLRSFDVAAHMPYYFNYPEAIHAYWTYAQLQAQVTSSTDYARISWVGSGSPIYADALYARFGAFGERIGRFIF